MPRKLKKEGTMQITAQEGKEYLLESWGEEKYKRLVDSSTEAESKPSTSQDESATNKRKADEHDEDVKVKENKKVKLAKHTTMLATAQESKELLKDSKIDDDAKTRNQAKQIEKITQKKPKLSKNTTMLATAKESATLLKDVEIDTDAKTRHQSKEIKKLTTVPKKSSLKKNRTMNATVKEGKNLIERLSSAKKAPKGHSKVILNNNF